MSTLKSSAENLTLNADGSNNDIIFQSNGSTKVTLDGQNSRLGIGTTTPQNKVHIATGDSANDNYRTGTDTPLIVEAPDGGGSYIQMVADANQPMGILAGSASDTGRGGFIYDENGGGAFLKSGGATRLAVGTAGDVTVSSGDIVFGTAGKGICLGVTTNTDANTLDDYEEGTFTPTIVGQAGASGQSYGTQLGYYTKVGRLVALHGYVTLSDKGTISGNYLALGGFPFVNVGDADGGHCGVSRVEQVGVSSGYIGPDFQFSGGGTIVIAMEHIANGSPGGHRALNNDYGTPTDCIGDNTSLAYSCTYMTSAGP